MSEQINEVVHIAPATIAGELAELGAERVAEFPDLLTHGPVARDPKKHRKARLKYWRKLYRSILAGENTASVDELMATLEDGYLSSEQLGSAANHMAKGDRIVVWTTPTFEDRLFLWMVFHALLEEGVEARRIATAEPQVVVSEETDDATRYASLRALETDELVRGYDDLFYPELVYIDAGANLWETFSSSSPRQFAISIPHTRKFFPAFDTFAEDYGNVFPESAGEGAQRLEVSQLDRALLERLAEQESATAHDIIDDELVERFAFLDELVFLGRLRAWSRADESDPYVEAEEHGDEEDVFAQYTYRITERGRGLLEEGFEAGRKLPIFYIGDARLYAGKKPWVKVVSGKYWWFERFQPDA